MFRPTRLVAALLFLVAPLLGQTDALSGASQSGAQSSPAVPENRATLPQQESTRFRERSDLVLVPVVVTDKSGKHVTGLQKEAFHIEEDGNARSFSVFEEKKTEKLAPRTVSAPPEVYSNFVAGDDHPWRLTAVLLDMINTPSLRQAEAKRQLIDYLLQSAEQGEPVAIFGLNGSGLHQLHSFTTNTAVLVDALKKLKLSLSSVESTQPPEALTDDPSEEQQSSEEAQLMSQFMQDMNDTVSADYQRRATRETLAAMTARSGP